MTEERAALGARLAELMGGNQDKHGVWHINSTDGDSWVTFASPEAIVSWWGYGVVDQYMREQGYCKVVATYRDDRVNVLYDRESMWDGEANADEPLAACQAALKALEARDGS